MLLVLFQKRGGGGGEGRLTVEDMEFIGVLRRINTYSNVKFRGESKKKWKFQGSRKNHVQFPGVLVFGLGISKAASSVCNIILQSF